MDVQKEEIYNSDSSMHNENQATRVLSDSDLNKKHKEFLNAIRTENIDIIKEIIAQYQSQFDIVNRVDHETGQTALFLSAILQNDDACMKINSLLQQNGANPMFKDNYQQTSLFHVCREGKIDLIKLYIEYGCDINDSDNFRQTPLFYACRDGKIEAVKFMLEQGADPNHLDQVNENALFYASREGKYDTCKALLEAGANVNQVDQKRQTALFFAKKRNHQNVIELLLQHGAVNTKDGRLNKNDQQKKKNESSKNANLNSNLDDKSVDKITSNSQSMLNKRKKEKEEPRQVYRLCYTDRKGESHELTLSEFEEFKQNYPEVSELLLDPTKIQQEIVDRPLEQEEWESVSMQILNAVWKTRGGNIFHKAVDTVKLHLPDYFTVVKNPMDLGTIKKKLTYNVYKNCQEWISDMELVFYNCRMYNGTQSEVGAIGVACSQEFERQLNSYGVRDRFVEQTWLESRDDTKNQDYNNEGNLDSFVQNNLENVNNPNTFEQEDSGNMKD